ncbi:DNA-binding response regulator [Mesorhizobium sp. M0659]|uniref:DNA-binding response regulator n=1 Tax=Mesorhizobium sp. M0659 TaxID=2956980 RepID=UPI00333C4A04
MIAPLTKRKKKDGTVYERPEHIERLLRDLQGLPRDQLFERSLIRDRSNPLHVPSECLVHFLRASRCDNSEAWFERLYKTLLDRVSRAIPGSDRPGNTTSLTRARIREKAIDRFIELVSQDRKSPGDHMDFFEVRFDLGIKRLRLDAQEQAWRDENRSVGLDDVDTAMENDSGTVVVDRLAEDFSSDPLFRRKLYAAIGTLPPEQSRTMHLLLQGWLTHSSDPEIMTIAKALNCSDRSVRNYKERALKTLTALFNQGDDQ